MSMPENWNSTHGVDVLQGILATTLYRLVPVMFSQQMSLILRREESQFRYEFVEGISDKPR